LGLPSSAAPRQVDQRSKELLRWLRGKDIPQALRPWAQEQAALLEELYDTFASQFEETGEPDEVPTLTVTEPRPGWRERLPGPVLPTIIGIVVGLVILAGIAWGQGRLGGGQVTTTPSPPQDTGVMPAVQEQIAGLEAVVARDPDNADALFQLGEIYIQGQQWEKAISYFSRLLEVQSNNAHAQTDIGIALMELDRFSESEDALLKAIEMDPDYVDAHYSLGFLYTLGSPPNPEGAREHWQKVVELAPGSQRAQIAQVHLDQLEQGSESK
jgi:hypothetical protein